MSGQLTCPLAAVLGCNLLFHLPLSAAAASASSAVCACTCLQGLCTVVASVGASAVPLAFSTLCATPEWLQSPVAPIFMAAFSEARALAATAPAAELAAAVAPFLPEFSTSALASTIQAYQQMGTWQGSEVIDAGLYQATAKVFMDVGYIDRVPPMELVVAPPPS